MRLTAAQIEKFQILYKSRFGKELNAQEALVGATRLMRVFEHAYQPMLKSEYAETKERQAGLRDQSDEA